MGDTAVPKHPRTRGPRSALVPGYPHLRRSTSPGLEADLICYKVHIGVPRELETENKLFCILCLA